jgi:hypothetical protein
VKVVARSQGKETGHVLDLGNEEGLSDDFYVKYAAMMEQAKVSVAPQTCLPGDTPSTLYSGHSSRDLGSPPVGPGRDFRPLDERMSANTARSHRSTGQPTLAGWSLGSAGYSGHGANEEGHLAQAGTGSPGYRMYPSGVAMVDGVELPTDVTGEDFLKEMRRQAGIAAPLDTPTYPPRYGYVNDRNGLRTPPGQFMYAHPQPMHGNPYQPRHFYSSPLASGYYDPQTGSYHHPHHHQQPLRVYTLPHFSQTSQPAPSSQMTPQPSSQRYPPHPTAETDGGE